MLKRYQYITTWFFSLALSIAGHIADREESVSLFSDIISTLLVSQVFFIALSGICMLLFGLMISVKSMYSRLSVKSAFTSR